MTELISDIIDFVKTASKEYSYLSWEDVEGTFEGERVKEDLYDTSRWETVYEIVTKFDVAGDSIYVQFFESRGSTEMQESAPLEDQVHGNLRYVRPKEVTSIVYVPVAQ